MDMAAILILACCVLHNFCGIYGKRASLLKDVAQRADPFVGVHKGAMRLSGVGRAGKVVGERMRAKIFES